MHIFQYNHVAAEWVQRTVETAPIKTHYTARAPLRCAPVPHLRSASWCFYGSSAPRDAPLRRSRRPLSNDVTVCFVVICRSIQHGFVIICRSIQHGFVVSFKKYKERWLTVSVIMSQGKYWLLTIPYEHFTPYLPVSVVALKGQLERGHVVPATPTGPIHSEGYVHWQLLATTERKVRLGGIKSIFGNFCHAELTRSSAADSYVFKEDTAIANTRFELGCRPIKRNSATDWDAIWDAARKGDILSIPASIRVRSYHALKRVT